MAPGLEARPLWKFPWSRRRPSPRSAHLSWPLPTLPTLYLAYHVPAANPANPDTPALGALAQAVFGETSPLYRQLVLKEQKVVTLMADTAENRDPGLFSIIVRVRSSADLS